MKHTTVLIIDEDVLVRQALAQVLQQQPGVVIRVCGDLDRAMQHVEEARPDLLLLSLGEKGSRGNELFDSLRVRHGQIPIAVIAPRNPAGAEAAVEALQKGALEVITKPDTDSTLLFAGRHLSKRLPPVLELIPGRRTEPPYGEAVHRGPRGETRRETGRRRAPVRLLVIGGCTGGVKALSEIVPKLPSDLNIPVVIVQHLPRHYTAELAERLDARSRLPVEEAWHEAPLSPGTVWIAPGGHHLELHRDGTRSLIRLHRGPRENGARPSIDLLFRSAAQLYGSGALGVVLSGQGSDGLQGARTIRSHGGRVLVENPFTALSPALPLAVIREGLSDGSYAAGDLSGRIGELVKSGESRPPGIPGRSTLSGRDLMLFQPL